VKRYRRTRKMIGATVAVITTGALITLGPPTASARWQVHNDADVTQIIPPPGGDETKTCADKVTAQSAWSFLVPSGEDPESLRPAPDSIAYQQVRYDVWKAPVNDPSAGHFVEDAAGTGVDFVDASDNSLGAVTRVSPAGYQTPARAAVPATPLYPPIDPTADNLYYYSFTNFTVPLTGVSPDDLLGIKPSSGGSTFIELKAVNCSPQPVTARIDVLPGTSQNVIHPKAKTPLIPVLVYGSNALNVRSIVKSSVRLKNAPAADVSAAQSRPFDADHDGKLDRRYYFSPVKTGITCGQTSVTLTGRTKTGIHFTGTNPIRTVC
jgi:hypothetical protein